MNIAVHTFAVREGGLEPPCLAALPPQSSASANFATPAPKSNSIPNLKRRHNLGRVSQVPRESHNWLETRGNLSDLTKLFESLNVSSRSAAILGFIGDGRGSLFNRSAYRRFLRFLNFTEAPTIGRSV